MNTNKIAQEAFEDELRKISACTNKKKLAKRKLNKTAFMKVEDLEDDFLGAHVKGEALTELAEELLQKEKDKSFALRHPFITGLPTMGLWPLIKEQYALRRSGRKLMRKDPEFAAHVREINDEAVRQQASLDEANRYRNAAGELVSGYLTGKAMSRG